MRAMEDIAKTNASVDEIHEINKYSGLILILDQPLRPTMTFCSVCICFCGIPSAGIGPFVQSLNR